MGSSVNRGRSQKGHRNVAESVLRAKQRMKHADSDDQALLTQARARALLEAGMCPFCPRGPFQVVTAHVSRTHDMGPRELRDFAGVTYNTSFTEPELLAERRLKGRANGKKFRADVEKAATPHKKRQISVAAAELNRKKIEEQRRAGVEAASAASKRRAQERYEAALPEIHRLVAEGKPYRAVAETLGVSLTTFDQWARWAGLPDGRARYVRATPKPEQIAAMRAVSDARIAEQRDRILADWDASPKDYAAVVTLAGKHGRSAKQMASYLKRHRGDVPDGRLARAQAQRAATVERLSTQWLASDRTYSAYQAIVAASGSTAQVVREALREAGHEVPDGRLEGAGNYWKELASKWQAGPATTQRLHEFARSHGRSYEVTRARLKALGCVMPDARGGSNRKALT